MKKHVSEFSRFQSLNEGEDKKLNRKEIEEMILAEIYKMGPDGYWRFASEIPEIAEKVDSLVLRVVKRAVSSGELDWVESAKDAKEAIKPNRGNFDI
jgi:hypothetical protein